MKILNLYAIHLTTLILVVSHVCNFQCSQSGYGFIANKKIGNLLLTTTSGKSRLHSYKADGYFFFFGYSRCNTTCRMGLQAFYNIYTNPKFPKEIMAIFVSIDLARDTLENLEHLKESYGDNMMFVLPSSESELRELTKEFEVQFSKSNPLNPDYEINHTSNIYFIDSKYNLSRIFTSDQRDTDKISNEIANYYRGNKK